MQKFWTMLYIIVSYVVAMGIGIIVFSQLFDHFNLLWATLLVDLCMTGIIFIFSVIVNNSSVYDPYWSVIPIFILILWWNQLSISFSLSTGIILISFLIWSCRLTFNWAINWTDFSHEDWRYRQFRVQFKSFYWVISLLGIHVFPTLMVFTAMLPIYFGWIGNGANVVVLSIGGIISISGVIISYFADMELIKHRMSQQAQSAIQSGIWKRTRHPNYLGELTFWLGVFVMGWSFGFYLYYTGIGFFFMVGLFEGFSIPMMEKRLLKSKVNYETIVLTVPKLIPFRRKTSNVLDK